MKIEFFKNLLYFLLVCIIGSMLMMDCSDDPDPEVIIPAGIDCTPGETQTCLCAGGEAGVQTCTSSGDAWGLCEGCKEIQPTASAEVIVIGAGFAGLCAADRPDAR